MLTIRCKEQSFGDFLRGVLHNDFRFQLGWHVPVGLQLEPVQQLGTRALP